MAGNANSGGARQKPFADALRMEIAAAGEDHKKLREIAKVALDKAAGGDMQAIQFIAERTDGKVPQAHIGGDENDPPISIQTIELVAVKPGGSEDRTS